MTKYWNLLTEIQQEHILDYAFSKDKIIKYFKLTVLPLIDPTFILVDNGCKICHVKYFNKNKNKKCHYHKYFVNNSNKTIAKFISLYNLPNSELYDSFGKLFFAINDINRFLLIISNLKSFQDHKLSNINNQIIDKF
jgi:hypothetical protein